LVKPDYAIGYDVVVLMLAGIAAGLRAAADHRDPRRRAEPVSS
jgi:hypothetical protein